MAKTLWAAWPRSATRRSRTEQRGQYAAPLHDSQIPQITLRAFFLRYVRSDDVNFAGGGFDIQDPQQAKAMILSIFANPHAKFAEMSLAFHRRQNHEALLFLSIIPKKHRKGYFFLFSYTLWIL